MPISIQTIGLDNGFKRLRAGTRAGIIFRSMRTSGSFLVGWVQRKRLSGPRPKFLGVVTGRLRSSIFASNPIRRGGNYTTKIGTNVIYARTHEKGRGGIPARPFLQPALDSKKNEERILDIFRQNIQRELNRSRR